MKKVVLSVLLVVLFLSGSAEASLIGDNVTIQRIANNFIRDTSVTVGPEIELYSWNYWLIDISDYSILMDSTTNIGYGYADFNGFIFSSLDFGSADEVISSVLVTGIDQSRVSFSDHSLSLNFSGLGFANTQSINIEISTSVAPVPEPSTLFLLGTGLIGLLGNRIRRKE